MAACSSAFLHALSEAASARRIVSATDLETARGLGLGGETSGVAIETMGVGADAAVVIDRAGLGVFFGGTGAGSTGAGGDEQAMKAVAMSTFRTPVKRSWPRAISTR